MATFEFADAVQQNLGNLRAGSLCFWGDWFGKPYDNLHRIVGCDGFERSVAIYFDHGECLVVDEPQAWSLAAGKLVIGDASAVRFQWYYYGRIPGAETLQFVEYRREGTHIAYTSDFMPDIVKPTNDPARPAVELF